MSKFTSTSFQNKFPVSSQKVLTMPEKFESVDQPINPNQDSKYSTELNNKIKEILNYKGYEVGDYIEYTKSLRNAASKISDEASKAEGSEQSTLYKKTIELLDEAIEFSFLPHWLHFDRGICYSRLEKYEEAIKDFSKEIELGYDDISKARSHYERGFCLQRMRKLKEAAEDYKKVIELVTNSDNEEIRTDKLLTSRHC